MPVAEADCLLWDLAVHLKQERRLRWPQAGAAVAHVSIARAWTRGDRLPPLLVERLAAVCSHIERFAFEFKDICVFKGGVVHLIPTVAEPFHELVGRCASLPQTEHAWVEPSPGTPHLTLAYLDPSSDLSSLRHYVQPLLPLRGEALEAHLVLLEPERRRLMQRLPLK